MILEMLLEVIYNVINSLMVFEIPMLPDEVMQYINMGFEYITAGAGFVANYVPLPYFLVLFGIVLAVDVGIVIYHFVLWIIKKIPMLGIE